MKCLVIDEVHESLFEQLKKIGWEADYRPEISREELQSIHHIGYENVAEDRQGVTDIWTDPDIKALIKSKGIELICYKDLKK